MSKLGRFRNGRGSKVWVMVVDFCLSILLLLAIVVRLTYGLAAAYMVLMVINATLAGVMFSAGYPASAAVFALSIPVNFCLRRVALRLRPEQAELPMHQWPRKS